MTKLITYEAERLFIALYEETYNIAHIDNYDDYIRMCDLIKYKPQQEIREYYEKQIN